MHTLWRGFKALLSLVLLVAAAFLMTVAAPHLNENPSFLGVAAMLVFFAALPWVRFDTPTRTLGLACIVFSLALAFVAAQTANAGMRPVKAS